MLHPDLLTRLDLSSAITRELSSQNRLLPPRWDYMALAGDVSGVTAWLKPVLRKSRFGSLADVVFADKGWRGTRPLNVMSLSDRIVYRALVDLIATSLPDELRSRPPFGVFQQAPLDVSDVRYVSKTDVTAYYEYVDHDMLADELTAQTGEELAIDALIELLEAVMGRRVGIPQVHKSSDVLGDTCIDPARRRLLRLGYAVFTYSDDFRISSRTLGSARTAIEACSAEARRLGLVLNERKTYTYNARNYRESIHSFADAERSLFADADHPSSTLSLLAEGYDNDDSGESEPEAEESTHLGESPIDRTIEDEEAIAVTEVESLSERIGEQRLEAARRAWDIWVGEDESEDTQSSQDAAITQSLLKRALPILGAAGDSYPLESIKHLLRYEPALAPQISAYVAAYSGTGRSAKTEIRNMLDEVVGMEIISTWQGMWLAYAAGSLGRSRGSHQSHRYFDWLVECVEKAPAGLAAASAASLGRLGVGDPALLAAALDRVGPEWRQLVLWGLSRLAPGEAAKYADNQLDRILLETIEHS